VRDGQKSMRAARAREAPSLLPLLCPSEQEHNCSTAGTEQSVMIPGGVLRGNSKAQEGTQGALKR
jgi:hypothetical protein